MGFLAFRVGDSGIYLFSCLAVFFAVLFITSVIKLFSRRSVSMGQVDDTVSGEPGPVSFVPHRFMMAALILAAIGIMAAIFIPIFFSR